MFFKTYEIKFTGLKPGKHYFDFYIDHVFFSYFDESPVSAAALTLKLCLEKQTESLMVIHFDFKGSVTTVCDRCLSSFDLKLDHTHDVVLRVENVEDDSDDDDIIYVSPHEFKVNVANQVYELILLQLPMKSTCELGGKKCDPEMLKRIEKVIDNSENKISDSPWEKLKELKNKFKD